MLFLAIGLAQAGFAFLAARKRRVTGARGTETGWPSVAPTVVGRIALPTAWILVVAALLLRSTPLRWWACSVFGVVVAAWPLVRRNLARARIVRDLDRRGRVGTPCAITYRLENTGRRPSRAIVVDDRVGPLLRPPSVQAIFDVVPARGSVSITTTVVPEHRGWRRLRPARVSTRFPLGLFEAGVDLAAPAEVLVRPREGRATASLLARLRGATVDHAASRHRLGTDELHGLREWREGDDPRGIHWRTSARRGALTYVERRDEGFGDVLVALARSTARGPAAEARFERAVSVATTIVRAAMRAGLRVKLVLGEEGSASSLPVRGRGGLDRALDALAEVRADYGRRPLPALAAALRVGDATVVWVAPTTEPGLVASLDEIGARRALVLAADDPDLARHVRGLA
jgi:uncharacterized protein (DUF58 family)